MERKKHKHQNNHVIIVTSDAVDANVKQFRIKPWLLQVLIIAGCVILGIILGYFIYEQKVWEVANRRIDEQKAIVTQKEEEIAGLQEQIGGLNTEIEGLTAEIEGLNEKIALLSETVNQKTATIEELTGTLEEQALPTEYPLTGSAHMEEKTDGDPMYIFTASAGVTVIATANGTVTAINEDPEYGHSVWVDHGNGYITIYRNKGNVNVKLGDTVAKGTTIYIIGTDNAKFGYQIMKDEIYIDPAEMLPING